jgi:glycosyltransferase involved in cell wall biosynthesis
MKKHKILIMTLYYERPQLVRRAISSVMACNERYENWHIAFHDDASPTPGEPIVKEVLGDKNLDKVTFYRTYATAEQKLASGGMLGFVMNQMIKDSDADLAIMLCDDDMLHPEYLFNLNRYFNEWPDENACYSHVGIFDPGLGDRWVESVKYDNPLNYYTTSIDPTGKVDAAQVAWRTRVNKQMDAWFPYPCHKNHDAGFYQAMVKKIGLVPYSGFVSQYKAIHAEQLSQLGQAEDTEAVVKNALHAANNLFNDRDYDESQRLCEQVLKVDTNNQEALILLYQLRGFTGRFISDDPASP